MEAIDDQPVTPAGRIFLRPELNQIINIAMGLTNPLNIEAIKTAFANSVLMKHPRFSSLLVINKKGREFWRKTQINIDDHFFIHNEPTTTTNDVENDKNQEQLVNDYLADFSVSSPLNTEKPLWEVHMLTCLNCVILRFHHALGDGVSLISLFLATCKKVHENSSDDQKNRRKKHVRRKGFFGIMKTLWLTTISVMEITGRTMWVKDEKTMIRGGDGVELWPRTVVTASFSLEDMKMVKRAIPNATINDVLFGVVSCGLSRYLDSQSPHVLKEGMQITGAVMVNLRKQPKLEDMSKLMEGGSKSRWGNQFGMILVPIYYQPRIRDPLLYVKSAKAMIDKKKHSLEAHYAYHTGRLLMSCFGPKATIKLNYKVLCNTTFTISNTMGPQEELTLVGNPIKYVRVMVSSLPHALTMNMVSYAGKADMQIMVVKDLIPEPLFLAKCFEDALLEMKNTVMKQP